jgi:hypothetical protein
VAMVRSAGTSPAPTRKRAWAALRRGGAAYPMKMLATPQQAETVRSKMAACVTKPCPGCFELSHVAAAALQGNAKFIEPVPGSLLRASQLFRNGRGTIALLRHGPQPRFFFRCPWQARNQRAFHFPFAFSLPRALDATFC